MEWVASTLHTTSEHGVYSINTAVVWVCRLVSDIEEENRLKLFGNRVLRKVFGRTDDEVTGE